MVESCCGVLSWHRKASILLVIVVAHRVAGYPAGQALLQYADEIRCPNNWDMCLISSEGGFAASAASTRVAQDKVAQLAFFPESYPKAEYPCILFGSTCANVFANASVQPLFGAYDNKSYAFTKRATYSACRNLVQAALSHSYSNHGSCVSNNDATPICLPRAVAWNIFLYYIANGDYSFPLLDNWPSYAEYNKQRDADAAQVIFDMTLNLTYTGLPWKRPGLNWGTLPRWTSTTCQAAAFQAVPKPQPPPPPVPQKTSIKCLPGLNSCLGCTPSGGDCYCKCCQINACNDLSLCEAKVNCPDLLCGPDQPSSQCKSN